MNKASPKRRHPRVADPFADLRPRVVTKRGGNTEVERVPCWTRGKHSGARIGPLRRAPAPPKVVLHSVTESDLIFPVGSWTHARRICRRKTRK